MDIGFHVADSFARIPHAVPVYIILFTEVHNVYYKRD